VGALPRLGLLPQVENTAGALQRLRLRHRVASTVAALRLRRLPLRPQVASTVGALLQRLLRLRHRVASTVGALLRLPRLRPQVVRTAVALLLRLPPLRPQVANTVGVLLPRLPRLRPRVANTVAALLLLQRLPRQVAVAAVQPRLLPLRRVVAGPLPPAPRLVADSSRQKSSAWEEPTSIPGSNLPTSSQVVGFFCVPNFQCLGDKIMKRVFEITLFASAALVAAGVFSAAPVVAGDGYGHAAVMTSGNGMAVSGTFGPGGFRGVYSGPGGTARIVQPARSVTFPYAGPVVAGVRAGSGPMGVMAIADPDGLNVSAVAGASAGAFAGASAGGGAVAIGSPGGVSVGMNGTGFIISDAGIRSLDEAKRAFRLGNYCETLRKTDLALRTMGDNGDLEQMRSAAFFAMADYRSAADAAHRALARGPAWQWKTLRKLYAKTESYSEQLRKLEKAVATDPQRADQHLLLGYHYLMLGRPDAARRQIERFSQLVPSDRLALALLGRFPVDEDARPAPAPYESVPGGL
jgi:hypothetical protein